jgi:protein-L-isoaspartate(D-aspartate) O-methyltransferase
MESFEKQRNQMVESQLRARGISDKNVLKAMQTVPREIFVSESLRECSYHDAALPIEEGQTISQPYLVAYMIEALKLNPEDKVLEVGAGSGYAASVLGRLVKEVIAVERHKKLAQMAQDRVNQLKYSNVKVVHGNGSIGYKKESPFDAILVSAASSAAVLPGLLSQLVLGGRLVIPIEIDGSQDLLKYTKTADKESKEEKIATVRFVPLISGQA